MADWEVEVLLQESWSKMADWEVEALLQDL